MINSDLIITLPKICCYNTGVVNNGSVLISDSNNSMNWKTLRIPLPEGKWSVYSSMGSINIGTKIILKRYE